MVKWVRQLQASYLRKTCLASLPSWGKLLWWHWSFRQGAIHHELWSRTLVSVRIFGCYQCEIILSRIWSSRSGQREWMILQICNMRCRDHFTVELWSFKNILFFLPTYKSFFLLSSFSGYLKRGIVLSTKQHCPPLEWWKVFLGMQEPTMMWEF